MFAVLIDQPKTIYKGRCSKGSAPVQGKNIEWRGFALDLPGQESELQVDVEPALYNALSRNSVYHIILSPLNVGILPKG